MKNKAPKPIPKKKNALTKKLILQVGLVEHEQLLDEAASYFCNSLKNEGKEGWHNNTFLLVGTD